MSSSLPFSQHTIKQLRFVLPGGLVTYLLDSHVRIWHLISEAQGWPRIFAQLSLACGFAIVTLFLYIMLIPWITGLEPNYKQWRQSKELTTVVPILTTLMLLGWPLLCVTLAKFTDLGAITGTMAASGLYALTFGVMGLLPVPKAGRQ